MHKKEMLAALKQKLIDFVLELIMATIDITNPDERQEVEFFTETQYSNPQFLCTLLETELRLRGFSVSIDVVKDQKTYLLTLNPEGEVG